MAMPSTLQTDALALESSPGGRAARTYRAHPPLDLHNDSLTRSVSQGTCLLACMHLPSGQCEILSQSFCAACLQVEAILWSGLQIRFSLAKEPQTHCNVKRKQGRGRLIGLRGTLYFKLYGLHVYHDGTFVEVDL